MQCPVCNRMAEEIYAPTFAGRVVRCNHCREFAASREALQSLAKASPVVREHALKQARMLAVRHRTRPVIEAVFEPVLERESA
jgi:hypothetical protein